MVINYPEEIRTTFNSLPNKYCGVLVPQYGGSNDEPIGIIGGMDLFIVECSKRILRARFTDRHRDNITSAYEAGQP